MKPNITKIPRRKRIALYALWARQYEAGDFNNSLSAGLCHRMNAYIKSCGINPTDHPDCEWFHGWGTQAILFFPEMRLFSHYDDECRQCDFQFFSMDYLDSDVRATILLFCHQMTLNP